MLCFQGTLKIPKVSLLRVQFILLSVCWQWTGRGTPEVSETLQERRKSFCLCLAEWVLYTSLKSCPVTPIQSSLRHDSGKLLKMWIEELMFFCVWWQWRKQCRLLKGKGLPEIYNSSMPHSVLYYQCCPHLARSRRWVNKVLGNEILVHAAVLILCLETGSRLSMTWSLLLTPRVWSCHSLTVPDSFLRESIAFTSVPLPSSVGHLLLVSQLRMWAPGDTHCACHL